MTDVQREQIPLLWSTVGETMLAKGFRSIMEGMAFVCRRTKLPGRGVQSEKIRKTGRR